LGCLGGLILTVVVGFLSTLSEAPRKTAPVPTGSRNRLAAASSLLASAKASIAQRRHEEARRTLEALLTNQPNSPEAPEARRMLVDVVAEARAASERLRNQAEVALGSLNKRVDAIEGTTWFEDKADPVSHSPGGWSRFHAYIGLKDGPPWLRVRVQYGGEDWLFCRSFIVVADGKRYDSGPVVFKRENFSETVREWYDTLVSEREMAMLRAVVASNEAVIRFHGETYVFDAAVSAAQKQSLQNVLGAFDALTAIVTRRP
jgi:hypothetical protein